MITGRGIRTSTISSVIEKFARVTRPSVFRSSLDNFSPAAPTIHQNPPLSLSLFHASLSLHGHQFQPRSSLIPNPLNSDNSVRKFSFGSRPVFHLKQAGNERADAMISRSIFLRFLFEPAVFRDLSALFIHLSLSLSFFAVCLSLPFPSPPFAPEHPG